MGERNGLPLKLKSTGAFANFENVNWIRHSKSIEAKPQSPWNTFRVMFSILKFDFSVQKPNLTVCTKTISHTLLSLFDDKHTHTCILYAVKLRIKKYLFDFNHIFYCIDL